MRSHLLALTEHPILKIKLLADNLESLIEDFAGILIRAGPEGQVDHALLFRLQVNRHALTLISTPRTVKQPVPHGVLSRLPLSHAGVTCALAAGNLTRYSGRARRRLLCLFTWRTQCADEKAL